MANQQLRIPQRRYSSAELATFKSYKKDSCLRYDTNNNEKLDNITIISTRYIRENVIVCPPLINEEETIDLTPDQIKKYIINPNALRVILKRVGPLLSKYGEITYYPIQIASTWDFF